MHTVFYNGGNSARVACCKKKLSGSMSRQCDKDFKPTMDSINVIRKNNLQKVKYTFEAILFTLNKMVALG